MYTEKFETPFLFLTNKLNFFDKLNNIQKILSETDESTNYKLGCYEWNASDGNDCISKINSTKKSKKGYPSKTFVKIINSTVIINDEYITNPPIIFDLMNKKIHYVEFNHNDLQILDALFYTGSNKSYEHEIDLLYSEHYGVVIVDKKLSKIKGYQVLTKHRYDSTDADILLPDNDQILSEHVIVFHTHPMTNLKLGGRVDEGILYEFPSKSDLYNFEKYNTNGKLQASMIVTPEGVYVIRKINYNSTIKLSKNISKKIIELENQAINALGSMKHHISKPEIFHSLVSNNLTYIIKLNEYLKPTGLFIEYYPRILKNDVWCLCPFAIQIIVD